MCRAIHDRMENWKGGRLRWSQGGEHEVLMEGAGDPHHPSSTALAKLFLGSTSPPEPCWQIATTPLRLSGMAATPVLTFTEKGIYCPAGDFYIDPWRPVDRALITHGHADHARPGMGAYLATHAARPGHAPPAGRHHR